MTVGIKNRGVKIGTKSVEPHIYRDGVVVDEA
jgi:hypothetical protein